MNSIKKVVRFIINTTVRCLFKLFLLPVLCVIRYFHDFKLSIIRVDRIGHLALNNDLHLRRRQLKLIRPETTNYCFYSRPICNQQYFKMLNRVMNIKYSRLMTWLIQINRDTLEKVYLYESLDLLTNEYLEYDGTKTSLFFNSKEEEKGRDELEKMGIGKNDWFICIHARDSAYMKQVANLEKMSSNSFAYHDYRDSDINNFEKACEFISSRGGFILRMGSDITTPIKFQNDKVIDYASRFRSDFMDIYLPAKCMFYLGNTSGHTYVSTTFDVPVACTNSAPLPHTPYRHFDLFIPKKYKEIKSQKNIDLKELKSKGLIGHFFKEEYFTQKGIGFIENTQEEILGITEEMYNQIQDGDVSTTKEQLEFRKNYHNIIEYYSVHSHTSARIAQSFLDLNPEFH